MAFNRSHRPAPPAAQTLRVDALEDRQMMSGNVTAELVDDVLQVRGDAASNDLHVLVSPDGRVTLTADSTRINGQNEPAMFIPSDGRLLGIDIRMSRGGDRVTVEGEGLQPVTVSGAVRVMGEHGFDTIRVHNLDVIGGLRVDGGANNDVLHIDRSHAGAVTVVGAHGVDAIGLNYVSATGRLITYGGTGSDRIAVAGMNSQADRVRVYGGDGADWIAADDIREVLAIGNAGNDTVVRQVRGSIEAAVAAAVIAEVNTRSGFESASQTLDLTQWPDGSRVPPPTLGSTSDDRFFVVSQAGTVARLIGESTGADKPTSTSTVTVRYHGQLLDGTVFDSSFDNEDGSEVTFPLANLITGWRRTIPLMEPGQRIQMFLPPAEGYGGRAVGSIPANSILMFSVELISFT